MSSSFEQSHALYRAYTEKNIQEVDRHIARGTSLPANTVMGDYGHFEFGYCLGDFLKKGHIKQFFYAINCDNFSFDSSHEVCSLISDAIGADQYDAALGIIQHPKACITDRGRRNILDQLAAHLIKKDQYHSKKHRPLLDHVTGKNHALIDYFNQVCFDRACTAEKTALAKQLSQETYRLEPSIDRQIQIESYCSNPDKKNPKMLALLLEHISWDRFSQNGFLDKALKDKTGAALQAFVDSGNHQILDAERCIHIMHQAFLNKDQKVADCVVPQVLDSRNRDAAIHVEIAALAFDAVDMLPAKFKKQITSTPKTPEEQATLTQLTFYLNVEHGLLPRANDIFNANKSLFSIPPQEWTEICETALEQGQTTFAKNLLAHGPEHFNHIARTSLPDLMSKIGQYVEKERQTELFDALYDTMTKHQISNAQKYVHRAITSAIHDQVPFAYMLSKADGISAQDWERDLYWESDIRKGMRKTSSENIQALLEKSDFIPAPVARTILERDDMALLTYTSAYKADLVPHDELFSAYCVTILKEDSPNKRELLENMIQALPETEEVQTSKDKAVYNAIYDERHDCDGLISTIETLEEAIGLPTDLLNKHRKDGKETTYFSSDRICLVYQLISCASKQYKAAAHLIEQGCPFHFDAVKEAIRGSSENSDKSAILSAMANSPYHDIITDKAEDVAHLIMRADLTAEQVNILFDTQILEHIDRLAPLESLHTALLISEDEEAFQSSTEMNRPSKRVKERLDYLIASQEIRSHISTIYGINAHHHNMSGQTDPDVKNHLSDAFAAVFAKTAATKKAFMTHNDNQSPEKKGPSKKQKHRFSR